MFDRVLHQLSVAGESELFDDPVLMEVDRPDRDVENAGDFLR